MRKLSLIFSIILLCSIFVPQSASAEKDKYASSIGVLKVVDNNVDIRYTGNHYKDAKGNEQYEYTARINQAPIYNDDGSLVDCAWHQITQDTNESKLKDKNASVLVSPASYSIINNVFSANVTGSTISTTYQGQTMSWNPIVMVDSKEYVAKGSPRLIAVDPINSNYQNNTLEWDYGVCVRRVRVIEGLIQETWIFSQDPKGTVWIKDNSQKSTGFTYAISPYAYDADGNSLVINEYKQVMASEFEKAVYPVTIDPTEVYVTSASDGFTHVVDASYNTAWTQASADDKDATGQTFTCGYYYTATSQYNIYRGYLYFDTTAIPDSASITSANVSLYGSQDLTTVRDFNVSVTNGQPTYPHDPLVVGDYDKSNYAGVGGSANTSTMVITGYNNISLNATGLGWINLTGITKLTLRSDRDINGTAPTTKGYEEFAFYAYEKAGGYRPYLEVTYTSTSAPTVTTNPATYVTTTTARLNGYLSADGGEACNVSFKYALWNGSAFGTNTSTANQSGKVTGDSFYADLTGLTNNSTYRFMAVAVNSVGTANGAWVNLTTLASSAAPTSASILCLPTSNSITLSWAKGNSSQTYIRWKIGSYPTSVSDGNMLPNQSGYSYEHTGLLSGTSYFYKLWGLDAGNISTANSTIMCSTTAGFATTTPVPLPTSNTSGWSETPNGSALIANPLYALGNQEASAVGIPQGTWWMLLGMGGLVVAGLFIYSRTSNLLLSMIAMIGFGVVLAQMGIFPIWTMMIFGFAGIGFAWKELR